MLNIEQNEIFKSFQRFINNENDVFILKGSAGTGKSTLLTQMFNLVKNNSLAMGPTGRSVKVLRDKGILSAKTIHSSIYEHPQITKEEEQSDDIYDEYATIFSLKDIDVFGPIKYIFVDEASMISDRERNEPFLRFGSGRLLSDLIDFAGSKVKIIFVGDDYQLPPVGDDYSKALDSEYLNITFGSNVESYELTQIQRQNGSSGILQNATQIRNLIDESREQRGNFEFDYHNNDIFEITNQDVANRDVETLKNGIIITYENKRAADYNNQIRHKIFGNDPSIHPGDKIIFSKNIYRTQLYDQDILNGDTATIINVSNESVVQEVKYKNEIHHLYFRKITFKTDSSDEIESGYIYENFLYSDDSGFDQEENQLFYIDLINRNKKNNPEYNQYLSEKAKYENNAKKYKNELAKWQYYVPSQFPTKQAFDEMLREKYKYGRKFKPTLSKSGVSEAIRKSREMDPFFNAIVAKFGYAVTCHKSQGGEWPTVFVDYSSQNNNSDSALRWTYTATTRAKNYLYVINPPKFSAFDRLTINATTKIGSERNYEWQNYTPSNDLMNSLFEQVSAVVQNEGCQIKQVEEHLNNYYVLYLLDTDVKGSRLQFYFNKKGLSKCMPFSANGDDDNKMNRIIIDINNLINR